MSANITTKGERSFSPFLWAVAGTGGLALIASAYHLNVAKLDSGLVILLGMTLLLSSRAIVPIPRLSSQISVSDTFVFLILLLYGGPTAVIAAAVEALLSSLRFSRKFGTVAFNWSCAALSIFLTSTLL